MDFLTFTFAPPGGSENFGTESIDSFGSTLSGWDYVNLDDRLQLRRLLIWLLPASIGLRLVHVLLQKVSHLLSKKVGVFNMITVAAGATTTVLLALAVSCLLGGFMMLHMAFPGTVSAGLPAGGLSGLEQSLADPFSSAGDVVHHTDHLRIQAEIGSYFFFVGLLLSAGVLLYVAFEGAVLHLATLAIVAVLNRFVDYPFEALILEGRRWYLGF